MTEFNVKIDNIDYKIDLIKLRQQKPEFSIFKGRRFILVGEDGKQHHLRLNDIFSAILKDQSHEANINEIYDAFQYVKNRGYEANSLLTRFTKAITRKFGESERTNIQDQLIDEKFHISKMVSGQEPLTYDNFKGALEAGYSNLKTLKDLLEHSLAQQTGQDLQIELAKIILDKELAKDLGIRPIDDEIAYIRLISIPEDKRVGGEVAYLLGKSRMEKNKEEARPHFENAAQKGHLEALYILATHYYTSREDRLDKLKIPADKGHAKAQYWLGHYALELAGDIDIAKKNKNWRGRERSIYIRLLGKITLTPPMNWENSIMINTYSKVLLLLLNY